MAFFTSFPNVRYKFGNENTTTVFNNISVFVDMIDQLKDETTAYQFYNIQGGDRPDNVSFELYGTPNYHWTFYMLNDGLRRSGWPLTQLSLDKLIKKRYPHRTIVMRKIMADDFAVGMKVQGVTSTATGVIVARNLDLGQIVVKPTNTKTFVAAEIIQSLDANDNPVDQHTIHYTTLEYLSAHHYEDTSGIVVDIDPVNGPGSSLVEVTYQERQRKKNDELKRMKYFKPSIITEIVNKFEKELK